MTDDEIFASEQEHLRETHAKLAASRERLLGRIDEMTSEDAEAITEMRDELSLDTSDDVHVESAAEVQAYARAVEDYNRQLSFATDELRRTELLLEHPYFAKLELSFPQTGRTRDVYLGAAGATDENERRYIVDWRSPVAEVYYSQATGRTSYVADGRTIEVDLECRRQFDLTRDELKACFDTTVAIEDPLLLHALSARRTAKLSNITATIQREQNEVIRHDDVEVLLVDGIAGSGKTSVLLQRIAYLFYQHRDDLDARQVWLFTPNDVFGAYIDNVLPDMGETNPHILTWRAFLADRGLDDRKTGDDTPPSNLEKLEEGVATLKIGSRDIADVCVRGRCVLRGQSIASIIGKHADLPVGPHLISLVTDTLLERLENRAKQMAKDATLQDEVCNFDVDEQVAIFGHTVELETDEDIFEATRIFATKLCDEARPHITEAAWLRIDRIGMRILGTKDLSAVEWLWLYLVITGNDVPGARFVMVDEVQDYTVSQLMVLERAFARAHFLLLGDEHQAIFEGTACFDDIRALFGKRRGAVDECRLQTSYRSSTEVTELFTSLLTEEERGQVSSVRSAGKSPCIKTVADEDALRDELARTIAQSREDHTLTAVISERRELRQWAASGACGEVVSLEDDATLPDAGVVTLDLALAKGLEFDHVIVCDADSETFGDEPLARCRLYTAISRATHQATILAAGEMTPLLAK